MRPRRFSAPASPAQRERRGTWAAYTSDGRWWERRGRWLASGAANDACPGCASTVGARDDVHHLAYPAVPGQERDEDLLLLCRGCHEAVHASMDAWPGWRRMSRRQATWSILAALRSRTTPPGEGDTDAPDSR